MNVSKVHNTAWREKLWRKMWGCGVEESFVNTKGVEARVVVDVQQSRWFRVDEGLRQGCPLSSLLYSTGIYIMGMAEELEKENLGVKVEGVWCMWSSTVCR